jgi:phosphoribosylanthranilate isomerase
VKIWVKICGVTRVEDALVAVAAGADAIGVNFSTASPRLCSVAAAREIVGGVGRKAVVYGLFVDETRESIAAMVADTGVTGIQLHGAEPESLAHGWTMPVLRAIRARSREVVEQALATAKGYRVLVDSPLGGGSGTSFDGEIVDGLDMSAVVVAGGLTPENIGDRVRRLSPWGVDVSSGVELEPGIKDARKVREFVKNAKSAG